MKKIYSLELEGDLDAINILDYNLKVSKIIENISNNSILLLIFDKVTYMNSTSVWHVADWYNKLECIDSEIIIIGINDNIMDIFNLVWLWNRITFYDTVKDFKLNYNNNN